jgi:fluoride exporter
VNIYVVVGTGAALGALARYLFTLGFGAALGDFGLFAATVAVNVLGSFVIGLFATLTAPEGRMWVDSTARQFVMSGLCGGFTTFSLASLDTFGLAAAGDLGFAGLYLGCTVALSLVAVWLGHRLAARLNR